MMGLMIGIRVMHMWSLTLLVGVFGFLLLVAPDFAFTTERGEGGTLKDHRGRDVVLLVLFSLPDSQSRLVQLDGLHARLRPMRVEVLGIPLRTGRESDRLLSQMRVRFPFVYDGAAEVATTYTLFRRRFSPEGIRPDPPIPSHLEFLIDRQGYIRARWIAVDGTGWLDAEQLIATLEQLNRETRRAAAPDDHVH
jgi:putative copper resistance protein D